MDNEKEFLESKRHESQRVSVSKQAKRRIDSIDLREISQNRLKAFVRHFSHTAWTITSNERTLQYVQSYGHREGCCF